MFDLTKQIKLEKSWQKKYAQARAALHVIFIILALYAADKILLPDASQDFFFNNIGSSKNTLVNPRSGDEISNGNLEKDDAFSIAATRLGDFSKITTTFNLSSKTDDLANLAGSKITIHKSYQAFLFPIGKPMGFKNGSLLFTDEGNYYIVSGNLLRKFANTNIILQFGFPKTAFKEVAAKDLQYNEIGPDINSANTYPDDSIFLIDNTFYQLKDQQLVPFISQRAFLTQYDTSFAISKDENFLASFPQAQTYIGYADGTLASSAQSVFILSGNKSYPVADAETFLAMGFHWENIIPLDNGEIGFYEQQKQFNETQPHPNGTLFKDQKTNEYFVIENGTKRPIENQAILSTYEKQAPVVADSDALSHDTTCTLKTPILAQNTLACTADLGAIKNYPGNYYLIETTFNDSAKVTQLNATLYTPFTWENIHKSLGNIKGQLVSNYTPQQ